MSESEIPATDKVVFSECDHADIIRPHRSDDEETPAKKRGNRRKSGIWSLFTAVDRDYALCNICDVKFSYRTSISNLKKHMINKHSLVPPPASKILGVNDSVHDNDNERNSPGCDRFVHVKKEKIVTEVPNRNRVYLDDCMVDTSSILLHANEKEIQDEFDAIGVTVAAKLRRMDERQRLYCEKIINEALFKGAFQQLCPTSELVVYQISSSPVMDESSEETSEIRIETNSFIAMSKN